MKENFFVLSGEHPELASDEVISISKSYDRNTKYRKERRLVITRSNVPWEKVAGRATFVRAAGMLEGRFTDPSKLDPAVPRPKTFACKVINLSSRSLDSVAIEREAGLALQQKWNNDVSLSGPSLIVTLIITDTENYLGISERVITQVRPVKVVKHPHELDWKLGRVMVNLSGLMEGMRLCDPFCGTGTILLEACSMGISSIGIDFDVKMCHFTKKNLLRNSYEAEVINASFHYLHEIDGSNTIDGIVTDLPYGISSRSTDSPKNIIRDLLSVISKRTKLVMAYKKGTGVEELKGTKQYEIFRHKNLTRVVAVR